MQQVRGNLRQPQWAIRQMGNLVMLVMPIKGRAGEGKTGNETKCDTDDVLMMY